MTRRIAALLLLMAATPAGAADCPALVSQSPYISHTLDWLGAEECIVGASRYDLGDHPDTGGILDPDAEVISALDPEWVLTSTWTDPETLAEATPAGVRSLRLAGFASMAEVEANIARLAAITGDPRPVDRALAFRRQWHRAAEAVPADGERVLLVSSCTGQPYIFGPGTWLHEAFETAGYTPVAAKAGTHHLNRDDPEQDVAAVAEAEGADRIFIFQRQLAEQCATIAPSSEATITTLDGDTFLHPAPTLIRGFQQLAERE